MRKLGLSITVLFLALALVSGTTTALAASSAVVEVGVIAPTTGPLASIGNAVVEGIKLAAKVINEQGGVDGASIKLIIYDDRNMPDEAVAAAKRLISDDKVPVIIGSVGSTSTAAVQQITMKEKIVLITPVSMAPKLTELGDKYFFRATATAAMRETTFARFVSQKLKAKTIAFLAANDDLGRSTVDAASKQYAKLGSPKVVYTAYFDPMATDFLAELSKIKSLNPDAVYLVADSVRAAIVVKQFKMLGIKADLVASAEAATNEFLRLAGSAAEGVYFPLDWDVTFDDPASKEFLSLYQKEYHKLPETKFAVQGWETMWVVGKALMAAGKNASPAAIRDALAKVNWVGPRGDFNFDEKGQVQIESHIAEVKGGKFVVRN